MENALIAKIFTDPICGDGVCDSPEEYAGFGRFGCVADCGKYLDTTTITIDLQDILQLSASEIAWDLGSNEVLREASRSGFKYNIYSYTMSEFLFDDDLDSASVTVEVPDGVCTRIIKTSMCTKQ